MFFTTTVVNIVSTIAAESTYVDSSAAMNDLFSDQDSVEVDDSKTNKNEIFSVKDPIKKCNDGSYIQLIITEGISASVLLELQVRE